MSRKSRPFGTFNDSDSDDSDYHPGSLSPSEDDAILKGKRKAAKRSAETSPKKSTRTRTIANNKQLISNGTHILLQFPPEILVKMFQYGIATEGIVKFIPRISRVCRSWYEVSRNPLVWSTVDIPVQSVKLTVAKMNGLMQNDLSCCRSLSLSGQNKIQDGNALTILNSMPCLKSLNLSDCYHLKAALLRKLPELCPQLTKLNMCFTNQFAINITVSALEYFLGECGKNLVELRLGKVLCVQVSCRQIFTAIKENCALLEVLDLSIPDPARSTAYPSRRFEFDADAFFNQCPKIRELYLDGFNLIRPRNLGPGTDMVKMKCLETLSMGYHCHEQADRPIFYRLFGNTPHLNYLDISCSKLLPSMVTSHLTSVTELVMRDMKWRDSDHNLFFECMEAWKRTLVRLDLSFNILVDSGLDAALMVYGSRDEHPLQNLNLKYTNITTTPIQTVIKNCRQLQEIDLTSCRELPRGCKHLIYKNEFDRLEDCLSQD